MSDRKLCVVQAAALGYDLLRANQTLQWRDLTFRPLAPVFPALTSTAQASFRTASAPAAHGMVSNGVFLRELARPLFWEQSARLVAGRRIWENWRARGKRVGILFWQQSLGEEADLILSPAPVHKHGGGMIEDCYSKPDDLYARLASAVGRGFALEHYWGPLASSKSGDWIASATAALLDRPDLAPELCLVYVPTLDYDLQRYGPEHARSRKALDVLLHQLQTIVDAARRNDYELLVFGDYAIGPVTRPPVLPNLALGDAELMKTRRIRRMLYPDFHQSRAFAMVDHEIAHVYVREADDVDPVRAVLEKLENVETVLDRTAQRQHGIDHARSGELVVTAAEGSFFAYPWWRDRREAPDYAAHVDIHSKPGYDPCELFLGRLPWQVSQDPGLVRGSHGRVGADRRACWASTCSLGEPASLLELATVVRAWLENAS